MFQHKKNLKKCRNVYVKYERNCRLAMQLVVFSVSLCRPSSGPNTTVRTLQSLNNHVTGSDILTSPGNFSYTCARSSVHIFAHKSSNSSRDMQRYIHMDNSYIIYPFSFVLLPSLMCYLCPEQKRGSADQSFETGYSSGLQSLSLCLLISCRDLSF